MTNEEIPGWVFETEEVSANVYRVTGVDRHGCRVQVIGTDVEEILEQAHDSAKRIAVEAAVERSK